MTPSPLTAQLSFNDGRPPVTLPVFKGSGGPEVIDIGLLHRQTGAYAYDPGFMSTAASRSAITFVDGERGVLRYRGYPIEQLAEQGDFLQVCQLLLYGELPTAPRHAAFGARVKRHAMVHEQMQFFLRGFRRDAHPMAVLIALVGAMAAFYHDGLDVRDAQHREQAAIRLVAKLPTLTAMAHRYSVGLPYVAPDHALGYTANFLRMMFASPTRPYVPQPVQVQALERIFILHADHEQNASTATVRLCGSTGTNPYAAVASGIACLWGPSHGGANEASLKMLEELQARGGVARIGEFIGMVKDRSSRVRLMGFGHRVYKNHDPRALLMRQTCHDVLETLGQTNDPLFKLAMAVERIALEDDYFVSRQLYPNVDFYSGLVMRAIGIPASLYTAVFAMARTVGWIAQLDEMMADPAYKIARPRQLYAGAPRRELNSRA